MTGNPAKTCVRKIFIHEKILCTRNCHGKFIKDLLPEKRKENMQTKQLSFKSRSNNEKYSHEYIQRKIVSFLVQLQT